MSVTHENNIVDLGEARRTRRKKRPRFARKKSAPSTPLEVALGAAIALEEFHCIIEVSPKTAPHLKSAIDAVRERFRTLGASFDRRGRPRFPASFVGGGYEFDGASMVHVRAVQLAADVVFDVVRRRGLGVSSGWTDEILFSIAKTAFDAGVDLGLRVQGDDGRMYAIVPSVVARLRSTGAIVDSLFSGNG